MKTDHSKIIKYFFDYGADAPIWDEKGRLLSCSALGLSEELTKEFNDLARIHDLYLPPDLPHDDALDKEFDRRSEVALNRLIEETELKGYLILVYAGSEREWIPALDYLRECGFSAEK